MLSNVLVTLDGETTFTAHAVEPYAWNGFAAPYFTREQADAVVAHLNAQANPENDETFRYAETCPPAALALYMGVDEPQGDGYASHNPAWAPGEQEDWWAGQAVPGDPTGSRVYAIGAYSWVWEIARDDDDDE